VALLRGINVGGHRQIKMAALQALFAAQGCRDARTYIQSGNVVFRAAEAEASLRQRLEAAIASAFGFPVTVALRTAGELSDVIAKCPFDPNALADGESLYVALLANSPAQGGLDRLLAYHSETDQCQVLGRDVYLLCRQPYNQTQFSNSVLERLLGVPATSRNWRTLTTLAAMAAALEP
jgi:uncharacterized protein (DUF1697 family)